MTTGLGSVMVTASVELKAWPTTLLHALPDGPWTVAHVRPQQDQAFLRDLHRLGIPGLALFERRQRSYAHGQHTTYISLIPGYVFVLADPQRGAELWQTERVVRLITPPDSMPVAPFLREVVRMVERAPHELRVRRELVPGTRVEVRSGRWMGFQGVLASRHGARWLVINLELLGHSVAVPIDIEAAYPAPLRETRLLDGVAAYARRARGGNHRTVSADAPANPSRR